MTLDIPVVKARAKGVRQGSKAKIYAKITLFDIPDL